MSEPASKATNQAIDQAPAAVFSASDIAAAQPQLSFTLGNPDAPGTIYVSTDPSANQLTLSMSASVVASYTPGTPVAPDEAQSASGSLLYLNITPLGLSAAEFAALKLVATGWIAQTFSGNSGQYICFTPTAAVTPTGSVDFALQDFTLATQPGASASLTVLAYRVTGISSGSFPASSSFGVVFANPDTNTGDLTTAVAVELAPNEVVSSLAPYPEVENSLTLSFTQLPNAPTIKAGPQTAFTLNFTIVDDDPDGYGALLTTAQAKALSIQQGAGASAWTITPHLDASPPYWTLIPPLGDSLFGASATLGFAITQLVTTFKPGPTRVLIGYAGVPGYKNGSFGFTMIKDPHVAVTSFTASSELVTLDPATGTASVTLSWTTSANPTQLTLQPLGADVTRSTTQSYPATITASTPFALVAEGPRPGNVDNTATAWLTVKVLPVINSFTVVPSAIYVGDFSGGYATQLAWNVNTNDNVVLTSSIADTPIGPAYPHAGTVPQPLSAPQMLTLTPKGQPGDPTVTRDLMISGFQLIATQGGIGHTGTAVAAPSSAGFVAVAVSGENLVAIVSTATLQTFTTVPTVAGPSSIAFSADGSMMAVVGSGGDCDLFLVMAVSAAVPFTFVSKGRVHVGGTLTDVGIGPDGTVYTVGNPGGGGVGTVSVIGHSGGAYAVTDSVQVGNAPHGLAISPDGATLYVTNPAAGTITAVTLGGGAPSAAVLLSGIGYPYTVALSPDGTQLLVAASKDNAVYSYSTRYAATSPRKTYPLTMAANVAVLATGNYAIATSASGGKFILFDYVNGDSGAVSETGSFGGTTNGLAVTPEGSMAFAAQSGNVVVQSFARYLPVATPVAAGGQVTDVVVAADHRHVIAWSDAMVVTSSGGKSTPVTGVVVAAASGGGATPYLAGTAINCVAVSPAGDDAVYVAQHGAATIAVYGFPGFTTIASIPIPDKAGATSRQAVGLAVSDDGGTLFALVADTALQFSMLVVTADARNKSFSVVADLDVYTATEQQLVMPMGIGAVAGGGVAAYALDTSQSQLWMVSGSGTSWSVGTRPIAVAAAQTDATASTMAIAPDGSAAYVALQQQFTNFLSRVDLVAGRATLVELPDPTTRMNIAGLAVSADGQTLFASDNAAVGIRVVDAASLRVAQTMSWQNGVEGPGGIAAARDGSALFAANVSSQNIAIAQQVNPA